MGDVQSQLPRGRRSRSGPAFRHCPLDIHEDIRLATLAATRHRWVVKAEDVGAVETLEMLHVDDADERVIG
ncbi:MAG: hypothetical protein QME60_02555 [Verrucomicrobiota bacterium]|nr:hypothetical protein [Verrucomicrobiota bacterium]